MNREEIKKAVADAVVGFARSEAEAAIKSIDLDDVQKVVEAQMKNLTDPLGSRNPDHHKLVGKDPEQAVYHLDAAGGQSHRGRCKTEDCMKRAGTGHREGCSVPAFYVILN